MSIPRWIRRLEPKLVPIGQAVWQLPQTFKCLIPKPPPPKYPLVSRGAIYSFPDGYADVCQMWCQSVQPFDNFPRLLNLWHPNPPKCPLGYWGATCIYHICPFTDESAEVNQSFSRICAKVSSAFRRCTRRHAQKHAKNNIYTSKIIIFGPEHADTNVTKVGANRSSRLTGFPDLWMCDPLAPPPPPKCSLVSLVTICLAYIHSQINLYICTKFGANRTSRSNIPRLLNLWPPNPPPKCRGANCI